jgi:hypothetical protein
MQGYHCMAGPAIQQILEGVASMGSQNRGFTCSHGSKKSAGKPVKPAGSLRLTKFRHGLEVGTGPVRVPGRTGSTGNRPNRTGSHRFCELY